MPQPSKQLLNVCPIPPVHVIVTLLAGCQSAILSSNEWHNGMNPAFRTPSWPPTSKSKKSPRVREGPYPSQIKTSADVPGAKGQIHTMLPNISTATVHRWGTGHKKCRARAQRANVPPEHPSVRDMSAPLSTSGDVVSPLHSRASPNKGGQNHKWLPHPCLLGGPKEGGNAMPPLHSRGSLNKGGQIISGCLTPTFSGAQKRAEMLLHPRILGGPQQRGQNQKSKPTLGVTMMPLVSQSMGL